MGNEALGERRCGSPAEARVTDQQPVPDEAKGLFDEEIEVGTGRQLSAGLAPFKARAAQLEPAANHPWE